MDMEHRRLGNSGLKVSVLSFGSWVTFGPQLDSGLAADCMAAAWDAGCNFFDNAEAYAGGESERLMGEAFRQNDWKRHEYVVSSKYYWGIHDTPNTKFTLNRKYLLDAIPASLERMGLEYLDLVYCHRADPDTPIEETVWAMNDAIDRGWALYWGTSEWNADEIRAAHEIAERHHLHKPVMEQPQYNMLTRRKVEKEYARLYDDIGLGLTTWSPLASGLLSGKYIDGIPEDSRAALQGYEWIKDMVSDEEANDKVRKLRDIAEELDATPAQLAIAWCAKNPNVSTVITGASKVDQVVENMRSIEVLSKLTDKTMERINDLF
ncbi:MAG: aldo/keto reductase [Acidimicrobiales bacterium]|nr:aldo/keto reductase [Acidimicrobiales bacterium]